MYNGLEICTSEISCIYIDESESMAVNVINKTNLCLHVFFSVMYSFNPFLIMLTQLGFQIFHEDLNKGFMQVLQSKCIRLCLLLYIRSKICVKMFLKRLNARVRYIQFIVSDIRNFYKNQ